MSNAPERRRSRVIALLLAILFLGVGHAYLGQARRVAYLYGLSFPFFVLAVILASFGSTLSAWAVLVAVLPLALWPLALPIDILLLPEARLVTRHSWGR